MLKRQDYISWDECFMGLAKLNAMRSKDPSKQVGACIVDSENKIVSLGYNGFPIGVSDDDFPWGKTGELSKNKHGYVCHAEANAILNSKGINLKGCTVYVTLFPCNECAKLIIQAGIKKVVYEEMKEGKETTIAAKKMFDYVGVEYSRYMHKKRTIELYL